MPKRGVFVLLVALAAIGVLIAPSAAWLALGQASGTPISYTQFLDEVGADAVDRVWQDGNELTVLMGGEQFLVVVPAGANVAADVGGQAAAHPGVGGTTISVEIEQTTPMAGWFPIVVTGVLPLVPAAGLLLWARSVLRRDQGGSSSSVAAQ